MELTLESSSEEVSDYFLKTFGIKEEVKNRLINESISGDVLLDIQKEDLTLLGMKKGKAFLNITNYLKEFKGKYKEKEIKKELSSISNKENIIKFLDEILNFKGNLNINDENEFLSLNEEKMKSLGLNIGQTKRLMRYINYFNKLKKQQLEEEDLIIDINEDSGENEVDIFLTKKLNLSEEVRKELDAQTLFNLKEDQIEDLSEEITEEEKQSLIKFIHKRDEIKKSKITKESKKEDIINFLKEKGYDENKIFEIDLEQISFSSQEEKDILKSFLENEKQINTINKENIQNNNTKFYSRNKIKKKFETKSHNLEMNSRYNIFFNIAFPYEKIDFFYLSIYEKFSSEKKYFYPYFVNSSFIQTNQYGNFSSNKNINFIIQVPSNQKIHNLTILIYDENMNSKNKTTIHISNGVNYFHFKNFIFDTQPHEFIKRSTENIITEFLYFFFDETNKTFDNYQKALIDNINEFFVNQKKNELKAMFTLKFFHYCYQANIAPDLNNIKLNHNNLLFEKVEGWEKNITYLNKDYIKIFISEEDKQKFSDIITYIYSFFDIKYLIDLIKSYSENEIYFCLSLFQLLDKKIINETNFRYGLDNKEIIFIQDKLFRFANDKDKINKIVLLSKGITSSLSFIDSKKEDICKILLAQSSLPLKKKNYELYYVEPIDKSQEDAAQLYLNILSIVAFTMEKNMVIINLNNIFQSLVNFYSKGELFELLDLQTIELNLKDKNIYDISKEILEDYHKRIHEKGMALIEKGKMNIEEIFAFLRRNFYYFDSQYERSELRDPNIFKYILIADKSNREKIKNNKLHILFNECSKEIKEKYYKILVGQLEKISDFNFIVDIFTIENIDFKFNEIINNKIEKLIEKNVYEKDKNSLFLALDDWIKINYNHKINISNILINFDKELKSEYFHKLIKNKDMEKYIINLKNIIFPLVLNKDKKGNEEIIISLLLDINNNDIRADILFEISNRALKSTDFYSIEENYNFTLYKLFIEKCKNLFNIEEISTSVYFNEIITVQNNIENDLKNKNVEYNIMKTIIEADKNEEFLNKIKVVIQNEEQAKKIYNELCIEFEKCKEKLNELENAALFNEAFFQKSKENEIKMIRNLINKYQNKNISELILVFTSFEKDNNFLEKSFIHNQNIEYRNSLFFWAIYNEINNSQKSEEENFDLAIENYKSCLSLIINQKESKEPFFKINYVSKIIEVTKRNSENNLKKEIDFTLKEFKYLEKDNYIKNDLLNDIKNFSKKEDIYKLLNGIVKFINIIDKNKPLLKTDFFKKINEIYNIIISENVSGEEISNSIQILKNLGYDINDESNIMKFFKSFKEDSLLFINEIKNSKLDIRSLNEYIVVEGENTDIQTSDIENLIYIYQFFNKIIDDKNVKTDENFIALLGKKFSNNILSYFENYQNNYGEIRRIYQLYEKNPDTIFNTINSILKKSKVKFFIENNFITFKITLKKEQNKEKNKSGRKQKNKDDEVNKKYKKFIIKPKEAEDLGNKIILLVNNYQILNEQDEKFDKEKICDDFTNLISNIKHLAKTLNSLIKCGYPHIEKFSLNISNSKARDESGK